MKKFIAYIVSMIIICTGAQFAYATGAGEIVNGGFEIKAVNSEVTLGAPVFKKNGNIITSLNEVRADDVIEISMAVSGNYQAYDKVMLCGLYSQTGVLKKTVVGSLESDKVTANLTIPSSFEQTDTIKVYLWDDAVPSLAYCERFSLPAEILETTDWELTEGATLTSAEKNTGNSSLIISKTGATATNVSWLWKDTPYRFSFFSKGASLDLLSNSEIVSTSEACDDWLKTESTKTVYTDDTGEVSLTFRGKSDEDVYVDDVTAEIAPDILSSIGFDGSFENGKMRFLDFDNVWLDENTPNSPIVIEDSDAYNGEKCIKLTNQAYSRDFNFGIAISDGTKIKPGKKYRFSMKCKLLELESTQNEFMLMISNWAIGVPKSGSTGTIGGSTLRIGNKLKLGEWVAISAIYEPRVGEANYTGENQGRLIRLAVPKNKRDVFLIDDIRFDEITE